MNNCQSQHCESDKIIGQMYHKYNNYIVSSICYEISTFEWRCTEIRDQGEILNPICKAINEIRRKC